METSFYIIIQFVEKIKKPAKKLFRMYLSICGRIKTVSKFKISLKSYLYACVRYKVFSEFRKRKITRVDLLENLSKRFQYATPETKIMHKELVGQIEIAVETLPEKCKRVYKLSRHEQLSHKEIAKKLNISVKTVENHITNALRILRMSLGNILSIELIHYISQNLN